MTVDDKAKKMELIKILRKETGVALMLCSNAVEEANNDLDKARVILRLKCIAVGEKYYKNPERVILFTVLDYITMGENDVHIAKMGCQSDFLIAADVTKEIIKYVITKKNFGNLTVEDEKELEDEMKYQSGLVKENVQMLEMKKISKAPNEKFLMFDNVAPSNSTLFNSLTVVVFSGELVPNEDQLHILRINIHSALSKKIVNIEMPNKPVNYSYELEGQELEDFLNTPMLTDKTKSVNNYLKEISENVKITHIISI